MGSASSHPQQPPLIALNGGTLGKHNNILVPAEAFAGKWSPRRKKNSTRGPDYRPVYVEELMYRAPPKKGRRRGRGRGWGVGSTETLSEGGNRRPRMGARWGMGTGMPRRHHPGMEGVVPAMPMFYDAQGMRAANAPQLHAGQVPPLGAGKGRNPGMVPGMVPGYAPAAGTKPGPAYPPPMGPPFAAPVQPRAAPPRAPPRPQKMRPPGVEAVAQGAYHVQVPAKPARRNFEPAVSDQLNRTQPPGKRAGPSGQEWIPGANAFLDACTCTTNCHCRKGARVLYRHQGEGDDEQNTWGEIRYVMKDDLGRDCGDHSRFRGEDDSSDGVKDSGRNGCKKKAKKKEGDWAGVEKMREEMKGLREDIKNMRLGRGRMDPQTFEAQMGRMPSQRGVPGMMEGMDPRVAQRMGVGDAFGMDFSPYLQQRAGMMEGRPNRMPGRMGGMGAVDMEDDLSFQDAEGMMNPMMDRDLMVPPHLRKAAMRRLKQRRRPRAAPRRAPDFDPHLEYGPRLGRRANLNGPGRGGRGPPQPPPGYDFDEDSTGSGIDGGGRPHFSPMDGNEGPWSRPGTGDEFNMQSPPPPAGQIPRGRGRGRGGGSGSGDGRPMGGDGRRPNQAHVDDGDDY